MGADFGLDAVVPHLREPLPERLDFRGVLTLMVGGVGREQPDGLSMERDRGFGSASTVSSLQTFSTARKTAFANRADSEVTSNTAWTCSTSFRAFSHSASEACG
ncbi:MAG: hypothetical protein R6V44_00030 [Paracoccaceae bacterium]